MNLTSIFRESLIVFYLVFLRLYLLGRSFMIHSPLVRNIPLRSIGYFNNVPINAYFLIKTYLAKWPTRCLLIFCTVIFLIGSWSLRACDYTSTGEHMSMSDTMWLFFITAMTIGLYPRKRGMFNLRYLWSCFL